MKNRFWGKIRQNPIIAAAAFAIALGVMFIPFAVTNTEKAAEFYGSFAAAIVAAVSILASTSYQAHLSRKRDEELRLEQLNGDAKALYLWLDNCARQLERAAYRLEEIASKLEKAGINPEKPITYGRFRHLFTPVAREEALLNWSLAARLPIQVAMTISHALAILIDNNDARNPNVVRDEQTVDLHDMQFWAGTFRDNRDIVLMAQSQLSDIMRNSGFVFPIPEGYANAFNRARTKFANMTGQATTSGNP